MEDIEDPTNLTGIFMQLNKSRLNDKLDLEAIEKSMIGSSGVKIIPEKDPTRELKDTLKDIYAETGIELGVDGDDIDVGASGSEHDLGNSGNFVDEPQSPLPDDNGGVTGLDDLQIDTSVLEGLPNDPKDLEDVYQKYEQQKSSQFPQRNEQPRPLGVSRPPNTSSSNYPNTAIRPQPPQNRNIRPNGSGGSGGPGVSEPPGYSMKEHDINEALRAYSGYETNIDMERENEEEMKSILLEDIDELRSELEADQIDLRRIPEVNHDSEIDDIKKIHKILQRKYDRRRYNNFGNEMILAAAQGLEYAFDGKRRWGPYSPDLTGWHNTIRPKLRRMRYETSTIVSGIMQEYNIGPTTRVLMELVPSAFLYSRMRKEQHGQMNYSPDQMSEAYDDLRQYDN